MTTETSTLIRHLKDAGEMTDAQIARALGVKPARIAEYESGAREGTGAVVKALNILAERVGFPDGGFTAAAARKIKPGEYVSYDGENCQVLSRKVSGGSPYFSLISDAGTIYSGVSFRFCGEPYGETDHDEPDAVSDDTEPSTVSDDTESEQETAPVRVRGNRAA